MPLTPGTKLGPYEIVAPLGAGGMGEVYRAHDTRLGRDVAIKVLPEHLSSNPEVRARFEREAKTVSSLNHPHICTLFDVGREGETDYLVMELVDGETLAQRLAKGPLGPAEVLKLGAQVADALDRAHRAGVIHRDLKPGNVMLTKSGAKLMDFGLARATGLAGPAGGSGITHAALTQSPTVAGPLTAEGTIVGTFQYMSPEQLEGREADARSDIWALGCVLYEMASGRRAFEGASQASLIGSIMNAAPHHGRSPKSRPCRRPSWIGSCARAWRAIPTTAGRARATSGVNWR
jgi:serine/threonine protein kinase